jgi:hypothetical protein
VVTTDEREELACRTYTRGRKHPLVIGKIGGWALPTPLSPTQLLVLLGSFGVLLYTRSIWAHLGAVANLLVQGGIPFALAWGVRHLRIEGRPPLRTLAGFLVYATAPKDGVLHGRPHHPARMVRTRASRVFFRDSLPDPLDENTAGPSNSAASNQDSSR